ncbi:MAG: hypothetical protein GF341_05695, partial [candidate division Zixibacteria bacterium]|nr:hypothetical protein [candidate division Zixibacteria bacterium]
MRKQLLIPFWLLLAVLLMAAPIYAQGGQPTLVVTDQVQSMEFHNQVTLIGRTEPRNNSQIVAEVSGRVT